MDLGFLLWDVTHLLCRFHKVHSLLVFATGEVATDSVLDDVPEVVVAEPLEGFFTVRHFYVGTVVACTVTLNHRRVRWR